MLADDTTTRPLLVGTAEPLSTIHIRDDDGALVGSAVANEEGEWESDVFAALDPAVAALSVAQTDVAGNVSEPTLLAPLGFHPTLESPPDGFAARVREPFEIVVVGWSESEVVLSFDGDVVHGGHQEFTVRLDEEGRAERSAEFRSPGTVAISVRYVDADPATAEQVTVTAPRIR